MRRNVVSAMLALFVALTIRAQSTIPNSPGNKPTVAIRNATIVPVTARRSRAGRSCSPTA